MAGVNRYQGRNLAKSVSYANSFSFESERSTAPCVFVSYKGDDKPAAKKIVELLKYADVDVYFDEDDYMLTVANHIGDDRAVVNFIEEGVRNSTHILAVISDKTKESWWVSFEIGSARRKGCQVSYVALKDVDMLPSYLKIAEQITSDYSVNEWIKRNFQTYIAKSYSVRDISIPKLPVYDRTIAFYVKE